MPPATKKRKLATSAPAEILFDFEARQEYLTGFHKRKLARVKHAQEEAAKREKEEKARLRREVRGISICTGRIVFRECGGDGLLNMSPQVKVSRLQC